MRMPTPRVWDAVQAVSIDDESRRIPWRSCAPCLAYRPPARKPARQLRACTRHMGAGHD
jgi:hypothetical protein